MPNATIKGSIIYWLLSIALYFLTAIVLNIANGFFYLLLKSILGNTKAFSFMSFFPLLFFLIVIPTSQFLVIFKTFQERSVVEKFITCMTVAILMAFISLFKIQTAPKLVVFIATMVIVLLFAALAVTVLHLSKLSILLTKKYRSLKFRFRKI